MKNISEIILSFNNKKILTGIISAIKPQLFGEKHIDCATINFEDYEIIIPANELGVREDRTVLRSMLGCPIDFIVKGVDGKQKVAIGSRIAAMELKKKLFINKYTKNDIIKATVTGIGKNHLIVESLGVETTIPKNEVAHNYVFNLRNYVQIGEAVTCKIKEIDLENNILDLSIKALKKDPFENIEETLPKDSEHLGIITGIQPYGVFVRIGDEPNCFYALCPIPNWARFEPIIGDYYVVRIKRIDAERRRINGNLLRFVKSGE